MNFAEKRLYLEPEHFVTCLCLFSFGNSGDKMRKIPNPKRAAKLVTMAIGQVTKVNSAWNAARVSVPELHRDEYLNLVCY